jgi:acetyltransferase EpsM
MDYIQLYGGSGHAKVIIDCALRCGINVNSVFDDNSCISNISNISVVGKYDLSKHTNKLLISIGNNKIRKDISNLVKSDFYTLIDISAIVSTDVKISDGTVVFQGAIIQTSSNIGHHCIINTGAQVDHDCFIDDFVHLSPNSTLCGNVSVGEGTHIGAGAVVIQGVKIGKWSTVGAGAVVINDIPDNVVVVGNPAKIIKKL